MLFFFFFWGGAGRYFPTSSPTVKKIDDLKLMILHLKVSSSLAKLAQQMEKLQENASEASNVWEAQHRGHIADIAGCMGM